MTIDILRCYSLEVKSSNTIEYLIFSNESEYVFSSAIYPRLEFDNDVQVVLITTQARVVPLKTLSIPKLEFLVELMVIKLCNEVTKYFKLNFRLLVRFKNGYSVAQK